VIWGQYLLGFFLRIWVVLLLTFMETELHPLIYITIDIMYCASYIRIYIVTYSYYRVKAILVILGITLKLFTRGLRCNNLDLLLSEFFGLFSTCTYIFKSDVVYIYSSP
jgi:hypothetical protein